MKASDLSKRYLLSDKIFDDIKKANDEGSFKIFYPHWVSIDDSTKLKLIENGFKVYTGQWDGIITDTLIIEW